MPGQSRVCHHIQGWELGKGSLEGRRRGGGASEHTALPMHALGGRLGPSHSGGALCSPSCTCPLLCFPNAHTLPSEIQGSTHCQT